MGKLHSLKKAIKNYPRKWYYKTLSGTNYAWGANFINKKWHISSMPTYKKFVAKTLSELEQQNFRS